MAARFGRPRNGGRERRGWGRGRQRRQSTRRPIRYTVSRLGFWSWALRQNISAAAVLAWRLVFRSCHIRNRATAAGHADRGGRCVSRALADQRRAPHTSGGSLQRGRAAGRGVLWTLAGTGGGDRLAGNRYFLRHRLRPALLDQPARRSGVPILRARS